MTVEDNISLMKRWYHEVWREREPEEHERSRSDAGAAGRSSDRFHQRARPNKPAGRINSTATNSA